MVIDDGTLFRLARTASASAARSASSAGCKTLPGGFDAEVTDETDAIAALAVQGPTSFVVLEAAGLQVATLRPFDMAEPEPCDLNTVSSRPAARLPSTARSASPRTYLTASVSGMRDLARHAIVGDARGIGLVGRVEGRPAPGMSEADRLKIDREFGARVDGKCEAMGLIVRPLINLCVFSPPLIITPAQIDRMFDILDRAFGQVEVEMR